MVNAVVTGAAGFVGAALVRGLASEGWHVRAVVHPRSDPWRLVDLRANVVIEWADVNDVDLMAKAVAAGDGPVVFHAAAGGGHPTDRSTRASGWRDTVLATEALWDALAVAGASKVVHIGSSLEYQPSDRPLREDGPIWPATMRGVLKAAAALIAMQRSGETGIPMVGLRLFSIYGPREQHHRVVPTLVEALRTARPFRVVASPSRRDFVYIDDAVAACLLAARYDGDAVMFNVGSGIETSIEELCDIAEVVVGRSLTRDREPHEGGVTVPHSSADPTLARTVLGWSATTALADGISRTYLAATDGRGR